MEPGKLYITAFYFLITTMTTVGYGDITPTNTQEEILAIFSMLIGVITFSYATGSLSSILSIMDTQSVEMMQ